MKLTTPRLHYSNSRTWFLAGMNDIENVYCFFRYLIDYPVAPFNEPSNVPGLFEKYPPRRKSHQHLLIFNQFPIDTSPACW